LCPARHNLVYSARAPSSSPLAALQRVPVIQFFAVSPRLELDPRGHAVTMPCGKDMSAKMSNAL